MSTEPNGPSNSAPPPPPPTFTPLFTLISTTSSPSPGTSTPQETHHHPTVHYTFTSDPDPLEPSTRAALSTSPGGQFNSSSPSPSSSSSERYIIIDLDSTGTKVTRASSLSPEWQITNAGIGVAPTWEGDEGGAGAEGKLMLRVEGVECAGPEDGGEKGVEGEGVEVLVERFGRKLGELRAVVEGVGGKGGVSGIRDIRSDGEGR